MTVLKAHFDGRVLVPEEPVHLPRDQSLEIHVLSPEEHANGEFPRSSPAALLEAMRDGPQVDPAAFDELEQAMEQQKFSNPAIERIRKLKAERAAAHRGEV